MPFQNRLFVLHIINIKMQNKRYRQNVADNVTNGFVTY